MNIVIFLTGLAVALGLAAIYGGAPERWTAGMFLAATLVSHLVYAAPAQRYYTVESYVAIVDVTLLAGITVILAKADRFWPIALFAIQGVTVMAHLVKLLDVSIIRHAYKISIAAPAYLAILVLVVGVLRHRGRMQRYGADRDWSRPV